MEVATVLDAMEKIFPFTWVELCTSDEMDHSICGRGRRHIVVKAG